MDKVNVSNERIKRRFFKWLKEADRCCDATVNSVEKSVLLYEDFTGKLDFRLYNPTRAMDFKNWLVKHEFRGKTISLTTYHTYLRYLRKFFNWLCWQPGFKSKINPSMVAYLSTTEKEERMATQINPRNFPPLDHVIKLVESIKIESDVDLRDRALIAFTLLSGMRDKAIITLPLHCFDENTFLIDQNPRAGVDTKFSKLIPTTLFKFDEKLVGYVLGWIKHIKTLGFGSQEPLFPRSKMEQGKDNLSFQTSKDVEPIFWHGTGRMREIFKERSTQAGLRYFPPHTFRHLAVSLAFKSCKNGEQFKAISQNFGHEHIATTMKTYGNLDPARLAEIIKDIDYSPAPAQNESDQILKQIKKLLP